MKQNQFVLVHGFGHGAWCWYKLKPLLEAAGHRVTVFDLSASGINTKKIQDVRTFYDYSEPLLEILASIPPGEKVTLVGHSLGGLNVALAMEKFPEKISVAVFVAALMPDTTHRPSYVVEQSNERLLREGWLDNKISPYDPSDPNSPVFISIGPKFMALKLYQLSPIQDLEIAKTLVRPGSLFQQDLAEAQKFSEERYGSVARVYIICSEDQSVNKEFQHWMIENYPVQQVMEIKGADHMAMCSKPQELSTCLLEISELYS